MHPFGIKLTHEVTVFFGMNTTKKKIPISVGIEEWLIRSLLQWFNIVVTKSWSEVIQLYIRLSSWGL